MELPDGNEDNLWRIILRTDDPRKRPLLFLNLLELQWYLQHVAALTNGYDDDNNNATASDSDVYSMEEGCDSGEE